MYKVLLWASCITAAFAAAVTPECTNQKAADASNQIIKTVEVGPNGTLTYVPDSVSFLDEDPTKEWFVVFKYNPKNHTVTESPFAEPCVPIGKSKAFAANSSILSESHPGIKSGFVPVTGNETFIRTFTVKVNNTSPLWIYCGQTGHCKKGMVMVINQAKTGNKTIDAFKALAANFDDGTSSGSSASMSASMSASAAVTASATATDAGSNNSPAANTASSTSSSTSAPQISLKTTSGALSSRQPAHLAAFGGVAVAAAAFLL